MTVTKRLLENGKVEVTTITEEPRYIGRAINDLNECEFVVDDFKENCKIWMTKRSREGFETLDTKENWGPGRSGDVSEDLTHFQLYLDTAYGSGKYEAYAVGAYIHGDVSFAFNKGSDNRDRWDSGTIGFIGIPTDRQDAYKDDYLTKAWEGIITCEVWDNLEDDWVDQCSDLDYEVYNKWLEETSAKYGIDWDKVQISN